MFVKTRQAKCSHSVAIRGVISTPPSGGNKDCICFPSLPIHPNTENSRVFLSSISIWWRKRYFSKAYDTLKM